MVRAPVARMMGLLPMLPNAESEQEKADILKYLNVSVTELDKVIREITEKTTRLMAKHAERRISD